MSLISDILSVAIVALFAIWLYSKFSGKPMKEIWEDTLDLLNPKRRAIQK